MREHVPHGAELLVPREREADVLMIARASPSSGSPRRAALPRAAPQPPSRPRGGRRTARALPRARGRQRRPRAASASPAAHGAAPRIAAPLDGGPRSDDLGGARRATITASHRRLVQVSGDLSPGRVRPPPAWPPVRARTSPVSSDASARASDVHRLQGAGDQKAMKATRSCRVARRPEQQSSSTSSGVSPPHS